MSAGHFGLFWLALCTGHVAFAMIRGVSPEAQAKYAGGSFQCNTGGEVVPASSVNDDFCDCADGSDEPGTGACAGQDTTLFHCLNEGATPQVVYSSRVDDGICDCCDGSDEAGLASRTPGSQCSNRCKEEGERELQERAERIEKLKLGLTKKAEIIATAESNRAQWSTELVKLAADLPALEEAVTLAKKAQAEQDAAASGQGGGDAELKAKVATLEETVADLKEEVSQLKTKLDSLLSAVGGEKQDADPVADAAPASGGEAAAATGEKKVVSEYAKWMDGAGSTPGAIEDEEALAPEDEAEDPGPIKPAASSLSSSDVAEAERKVRENKQATTSITKKLDQVKADKASFASLVDKCLNKHDGQYEYKLCFYTDARQDSVLLGRWEGWTGAKEAMFTDGHMCPGGPARDLKVIFECGSLEEVIDVAEPSRCSYEAHVTHPGACLDEDMAFLEKPPVKHPKDEL